MYLVKTDLNHMAVQKQDTLQCGPLRATAEESSSMVLPLSSINIVLGQNLITNAPGHLTPLTLLPLGVAAG
jgi:hypothetical protein